MLSVITSDPKNASIFVLLVASVWLAAALIAIYHIVRDTKTNGSVKILWFMIVCAAPIAGALVYLFWGKNKRF
ncbi:PLD nuclease N-terminal domain-containing protein [Pedobacter sp. MW01-1-1]|uniref:PLD nuclease N-terminal domain-containing protein n=1 Tax=Pedobacter sp. MW01-1-1 TaxID=3383027 RepID=UPI003FED83DF